MAQIVSKAITFLDRTDHNQLSAYLTSILSTLQTCTSNNTVYNPDWTKNNLNITLNAFYNQLEVDYTDTTEYEIRWYRQYGIQSKQEITANKNKRVLTITTNELKDSNEKMITYWCKISLTTDADVNFIETSISYTLIGESKSVFFEVYAPEGNVFVNQNGTKTLKTNKYYGTAVITSGATYQWYKYDKTDWQVITGATSDSLTVSGTDVLNVGSYKCIMKYNTVEYIGVITLQDKSDPYQSEIYTIGGSVFKNGIGGCATYVIVRQNSLEEVDPLKGPISATAPSGPKNGDFWYCIDDNNDKIIPKKYNGSSWVNTTITEELVYNWSITNSKGEELTFKDGSETKTGKVIYISCADIKDTCIVNCDISRK